jgi:tetrahydromethanopterin S-methyltransferase subunit D
MTHMIIVPSVKTVLTNGMTELQKIKTLKIKLKMKKINKREEENNTTPQNTGHCLPSTWFVAVVIKIAALLLMMRSLFQDSNDKV